MAVRMIGSTFGALDARARFSSLVALLAVGGGGASLSIAQYMDAPAGQIAAPVSSMVATVALVALLAVAATLKVLARQLGGQPADAAGVAHAIAAGAFDGDIPLRPGDDSSVLAAMKRMQDSLLDRIERDGRRTAEAMRIKIALDNSTAAITISDTDGILRHATPAAGRLLKIVSGQAPEALLGKKLTETVITDPDLRAGMNDAVVSGRDIDAVLGARHLRLSARPILDEQGQTLGRVTTWLDRTDEVQVEREVAEIVEAAAMGVLSMRLNLAGKEGFFAALGGGINQFLDSTEQAMTAASGVLGCVAKGDLTQRVEGDYTCTFGQLKDDTNATVDRLQEVVGEVKEASDAINTAAQEIAAGNQDLAMRTERQVDSLEKTASSMEELNATVKQNADNSRQATELARNSNEIAVKGGTLVKRVVATMGEIQGSSRKIADIIGVIDSIAFQTNILALNAAVEAARAGEQGRGFAVVATEVRNLAQRSTTAAREIKTLIAESVDKVESGAKLVQEAGETMDDVVTSFELVANLVTEISNASREQSAGIDQVTKAVTQMDEVTQQNAALVEEAAAAAGSLEEQARKLMRAVGMFKLAGDDPMASDAREATFVQRENPPPDPRLPYVDTPDDEWETF